MDLKEVMNQKSFAIVGDTLNEEKYAYKIKTKMLHNGYTVHSVGKELESINDIPEEIDIIDLCIHPAKGLKLMQECTKPFKGIVIQPGAESDELISYLQGMHYSYIQGCLLVGLSLFVEKV
ncbi:MAG: CoA-binding protein [Clostridia bacterium]|nr:CoA-binding protein [Clostridia bacterium]